MGRERKPTIEDIARLAGVSRTTVSRVLNHRPDVDQETRERVQAVIAQQGYVPNAAAAGLAGGRNRLIGMLLPSFAWSIIPELMRGISQVINETSYELVLYCFNDEDLAHDRRDMIKRLMGTHLTSGILAVFPGRITPHLTDLYRQGLPVVIIDDQQMHTVPWVRADNVAGGFMATQHLIRLGHRRIAHLMGPREYLASHDRAQGYRLALLEAGITPDSAWQIEGDFLPPSGRMGAEQLFALPPEKRPTAIFVATDQMGYGVLRAAEAAGLNIPGDIALVGFDDDAPSAHVHPSLTTIRQPSFEMGQSGISLLLSLLAAAENTNGETLPLPASPPCITLPTSLIVRESCGAHLAPTIAS